MSINRPIYIFDNDADYSDHSVLFVRSHWPADVTEAAMHAADRCYPWRLVGIVAELDWRDENELSDIAGAIGCDVSRETVFRAIGPERAREVVDVMRGWKQWPGVVDAIEKAERMIAAAAAKEPEA